MALDALHTTVVGTGTPLLLVHGSAADASTWTIQMASLRTRFRMIVPDRRGTPASPAPEGAGLIPVAAHARDLAAVIEAHAGGPLVACGSSFGAVVVLELARRSPELVRGMILCEPPLPPRDAAPAVPAGFGCEFDRRVAEAGGEAAGELFLRAVLGDEAFERIPRSWRARACGLWRQIRGDMAALGHYRVRYDTLHQVAAPALLLTGARSAPFYRPTVEALAAHLPRARLEVLEGAGHMMHADVHRRFNELVTEFARGLEGR